MAIYLYRCTTHGETEVSRPIGSAPPTWTCPVCHGECARVFLPPLLSLAPSRVVAAIDRAAVGGHPRGGELAAHAGRAPTHTDGAAEPRVPAAPAPLTAAVSLRRSRPRA